MIVFILITCFMALLIRTKYKIITDDWVSGGKLYEVDTINYNEILGVDVRNSFHRFKINNHDINSYS